MKRFYFKVLSPVILLLMVSTVSMAAVRSPVKQLQGIADRMLTQLEHNKSSLHQLSVIRRIVNRTLLPNIDLNRMSTAVVGRYWRSASGAQRAKFKRDFAFLVTTTYASALSSYESPFRHQRALQP